jgi:very-short-patch-repair endonuclease
MTKRARRLRGTMTDAETKLWQKLRRNGIDGFTFRRQHPLGASTLDFYCPSLRLAIEIDGGQHATASVRRRDANRERWLEERGILTLRFWNNDVLADLDGVSSAISEAIAQRRGQTPSLTLPLSGGEKPVSTCLMRATTSLTLPLSGGEKQRRRA